MRHNQNGRRYRGRGGGQNHHHNNHNNHNNQRRINPRVHTFDSNGPDVRIRGNAYQVTEKYQALAKDAAAAGDRVLAESYLQHAEHYQRLINEMSEDYGRQSQPQQLGSGANGSHHQQPQQNQPQQRPPAIDADGAQPDVDASLLSDLDQGFLVGRRSGRTTPDAGAETGGDAEISAADVPPGEQRRPRGRRAARSVE